MSRAMKSIMSVMPDYQVLLIEEKRPNLITQADSIRTKALVGCSPYRRDSK